MKKLYTLALLLFVVLNLSQLTLAQNALVRWNNTPGNPVGDAAGTTREASGYVTANPVSLSGLVLHSSWSSGDTKSIFGFAASLASGNTSTYGTSYATNLYEEYGLVNTSGSTLNISGIELYLGSSSSSGLMKVNI